MFIFRLFYLLMIYIFTLFRVFLGEKSRLFFQSPTPSVTESQDDVRLEKELAQTAVQVDSQM